VALSLRLPTSSAAQIAAPDLAHSMQGAEVEKLQPGKLHHQET
jgi:hypothetical protein